MKIMMALKIMQEIAKSVKSIDNVQVKILDHLPNSILTIVDPEYSHGIIYVTLNGFGQQYLRRPSFILQKKQDGDWFKFYQETFENTWTSPMSEIVDLSKEISVNEEIAM